MLRVLTLCTLFPDATRPTFGGFVEKQTLALTDRDGAQVEVVAPIGIAPWPLSRHSRYSRFADVPECEIWKGLTVHRPRFPVLPLVGPRIAPALMASALLPHLKAIRERFAFDVIDAQFFWPDGPAAMQLAEALCVPYSIKARGSDILFWGRQRGCVSQLRAAAEKAAGLLAVSESLKRDMVAMGMPADKIRVHYTGVDRERFHPVDRAEAKRELGIAGPLVASVGALTPGKGHKLAIEAVSALDGVGLLIVGAGPEHERLQAQIAAAGCAQRIRLLGNQPHDEVARLLAAADVMVLASSSEGLANAWVEALACGTPVVISDAGGAREVVCRPEAGALVARDAVAIASAVKRLLADPPSQDAVRAVVQDFSWERNSKALFEYLSKLRVGRIEATLSSNGV